MATQTPTRTPAETSRDAQLFIASEAASLAAKAWPDVDLKALRRSLPQLRLAALVAVRKYAPAAISAALLHYREQRTAVGIPGRPRFNTPQIPTVEHVSKSVDWAAQPLWGKSDIATAEKRLEAVIERLVLNTGRDTIVGAVEQDRRALAYARVPEPACCSWCAMLATRGAVYKSAQSAGDEHAYHDHCRCHVEPVFTAYEPTAQIRQWQSEWTHLKRELGHSPSLNEWRKHFDGLRPVE